MANRVLRRKRRTAPHGYDSKNTFKAAPAIGRAGTSGTGRTTGSTGPLGTSGPQTTTGPQGTSSRSNALAIALFAISLVVFLGGIGDLAWAVNACTHEHATPATSKQQLKNTTEKKELYGDLIVSGSRSADAGAGGSGTDEGRSTAVAGADTGTTASGEVVDEPRNVESGYTGSEYESDSGGTGYAGSGSSQSYVIHHDACQQTPIYSIVHHQASIVREVTVGGTTKLEWTSCPVCGQKHDAAYNERIVDHISETHCSACGQYHASAYDETVYY